MSIKAGRHYIIKAKEDTHKVFNLLKKGRNLEDEGEHLGKRRFEYQIDDTFKLEGYWNEYTLSINFSFVMKDPLCYDCDLYECVEKFYYDEKSNLHIITSCLTNVIGKWLESQNIYYYYEEWTEYGHKMTNDVGGEFFKVTLRWTDENIESYEDICKWYKKLTGEDVEDFYLWSLNDQVEFCKKHSIPYEFNVDLKNTNIKLPKHKIFEDTETVIKKIREKEELIKIYDSMCGRDMSVFEDIDEKLKKLKN